MPTVPVPVYENQTVQERNLPGVELQAPDVGAAGRIEGAQLQQLGGTLDKMGSAIQAHQIAVDEARVRDNVTKLMDMQRGLLHDPEYGYLNKVGKDAVDAHADVGEKIQGVAEAWGNDLDNDNQRRMWRDTSAKLVISARTAADNHALQQGKVYDVQSKQALADASVGTMVADAANYNLDGSNFKIAYSTAKQHAKEVAQAKFGEGADPIVVAGAVQLEMTKAHTQVIQQMMMSGDTKAARNYFDMHKELKLAKTDKGEVYEIAPAMRDAIEKQLKTADVGDQVIAAATAIERAHPNDPLAQETAALEAYSGNAEVLKGVRTELSTRHAIREKATLTADNTAFGAARDLIEAGKITSEAQLDRSPYVIALQQSAEFNKSPQAHEKIAVLRDHLRLNIERKIKGKDREESDPVVYENSFLYVGSGDKQHDLALMPDSVLLARREKLKESDWQSLVRAVHEARKDKPATDPANVTMPLFNSIITAKFNELGWTDKEKRGRAMGLLLDHVLDRQKAKGERFNEDQLKVAIDKAFRATTTAKGRVWDSTVPVAEIDAIRKIPAEQLNILKKMYPKASNAEIINKYQRTLLLSEK